MNKNSLYENLLTGDASAANDICQLWLPQIKEMAEGFDIDEDLEIEDLIGEGNMGLWSALTSLPAGLTVEDLDDYLAEAITTAISDYLNDETDATDKTLMVLEKANLIKETSDFLTAENGEAPTNEELAEYLNIPMDELEDIFALIEQED